MASTDVLGIKAYQVTITAGTRIALSVGASPIPEARQILIKAQTGNSGNVYLGGSDVSSTKALLLASGASVSLGDIFNASNQRAFALNQIYVDGSSSGDKVEIIIDSRVSASV